MPPGSSSDTYDGGELESFSAAGIVLRRQVEVLLRVTFPSTWSDYTHLLPSLLPPLIFVSHMSPPLGPSSSICDDGCSHLSGMRDAKKEGKVEDVVGARVCDWGI